jgi:glucosamine--fructose-6-phosphate aminotransferase (isomerizing)
MMIQVEKLDTMLTEIREQPEVLSRTIAMNRSNLEELGRTLEAKIATEKLDNVMIVARGSSDHAAILGKYLIESLAGLPVALAAPSVINHYHAALKLRHTLVIGVSQSGDTNEVIDFVNQVRSEAGFTIGITNNPNSQLATMGLDGYLFCHAGTETAVAATKSFTATMMTFYLLATYLSQNTGWMEQLNAVPALVARVLGEEPAIAAVGGWLAKREECILLARGYSYPVALEAGLKLQETSYIRAKAFSGADFQHGPLAITEAGVPFLVFKAAGSIYEGMNWLEESVRQKGADVAVISSLPGEISSETDRLVKIPECPEWLSPFGFTVAGQLLAYHTARARGIDPDQPRWLNKVTLTR